MFRVLLINPYITQEEDERTYPQEPLGLLYLATYLKRACPGTVTVSILDAQLEGPNRATPTSRGFRSGLEDGELGKRILDYSPDLVGISSLFGRHVEDVLEVARTVKALVGALVVLGGPHATTTHLHLIKHECVDAIVRGEGEETFLDLVRCFQEGRSLAGVPGITYREGGAARENPNRPRIKDLDVLPIPDRSLVDYRSYLEHGNDLFSLRKPVGAILSSRGCPYTCSFCVVPSVWKTRWYGRSVESVLEEIRYLMEIFGVREIYFMDDQFLGDRKRVIELCHCLRDEHLKLSLVVPPGLSPVRLDEEVLQAMAEAGFYRVCFSLDVGTEETRRTVRKPVQLSKARDLVRMANRRGLWTYATFVIGFPEETEEDILETIAFSRSLRVDYVKFYVAQAYFGTSLYEDVKALGLLDQDALIHAGASRTARTTDKRLRELRDLGENGYALDHLGHFLDVRYVRGEFLPKLLSVARFRYFLHLVRIQLVRLHDARRVRRQPRLEVPKTRLRERQSSVRPG